MRSKFETLSTFSDLTSADIEQQWEQSRKDCQEILRKLYGKHSQMTRKNFPWKRFLREMNFCTKISATRAFYEQKLKSNNLQLHFKAVTKKRSTAFLQLTEFIQKHPQEQKLTALFSVISSFKSSRRNVRKIVPELKAKEEQLYADMLETLNPSPNSMSKLKTVCEQLIDFYYQNYGGPKPHAKITEDSANQTQKIPQTQEEQNLSYFKSEEQASRILRSSYQFSLEDSIFYETPLVQKAELKSDQVIQKEIHEAQLNLGFQIKQVELYMSFNQNDPIDQMN